MFAEILALSLLSAPLSAQTADDRCRDLTHKVDLSQCPPTAFDGLVDCLASPNSKVRYDVIRVFTQPGVLQRSDFLMAVLPAGRKAVALVRQDPDLSVRYASGWLSDEMTHWENRHTPPRPPAPPSEATVAINRVIRVVTIVLSLFPFALVLYRKIPKPPPEMRGKL